MSDFINDLKTDILESNPDTSETWAEYCAIAPLTTALPYARIVEKQNPLKLNLLMLTVAPAGIGKSLPMFSWTKRIIEDLGNLVERDFLLPQRNTVEGLIKYLNDENRELPRDVGIIIRDEYSGMFKGFRKNDWQSDGMEFLSEMYDGNFIKRATTSHGLNVVENLYASLITATTPYFIGKMDSDYFIQGTGNRFLYDYYGIDEYEPEEIDPSDYFSLEWGSRRDITIEEHATKLETVFNKNIGEIFVDKEDAGKLYADYKKQCETEWKTKGMEDPTGWDYYPIKRYPELVLKLSGIYCVSSFIDIIPKMSTSPSEFLITEKQMKRAIELVERNRDNFRKIVEAKRMYVPRRKPISIEDEAKVLLAILANAKDRMLTSGQWLDMYSGTANRQKKDELRRFCISRGWVKSYRWNDLKHETRMGLRMKSSSTAYEYIGGL
jgi:hypothetical protein